MSNKRTVSKATGETTLIILLAGFGNAENCERDSSPTEAGPTTSVKQL